MDAKTLLERLFPGGCDVAFDGIYFSGTGHCAGTDVAVIGTVDNTPIGIELAYRMAGAVLEVVRHHPGRPILLLVDTQGQRLSHRDELLGINGYMAHLAKCLDLARRRGHRILGLVYSHELSASSPVFAPGVDNYLRMGAIEALWEGDLAACLAKALAAPVSGDRRRVAGEERQGRTLARAVSDRVRRDAA